MSSLIYATVYFPLRGQYRRQLLEYLLQSCDFTRTKYSYAGIFLCGDFNYLKPNWIESSKVVHQIVKVKKWGENTLDLIFTTVVDFHLDPSAEAPLLTSDRATVILRPKSTIKFSKPTQFTYRPLTEESIVGFREWLNLIFWFRLFENKGTNSLTKLCEQEIRKYEWFFPEKRVTIRVQNKPWVTPTTKASVADRDMLYEIKLHSDQYKRKRNMVVKLLKQAICLYGHQIFAKLSASDPRKFHITLQELMGQKKSKSTLRD